MINELKDLIARRPTLFNLFLFLGFPVVLWLILKWVFGFDGFYGQDSYAYLKQASEIKAGDIKPWFYPPAYAFLGVLFSYLFGSLGFALQLVSVLSVGFTAFMVHRILEKKYPNKLNALIVFAGFMCSAYFLRSGMIVMSDAASMLFVTLTFYLYTNKNDRVIIVLIVASFALLNRYAVAPLLVPILIAFGVKWMKQKKVIIPVIVAFVGIAFFIIYYDDVLRGFGYKNHYLLSMWDVSNFFKTSFITPDGTQNNSIPNLLFVFCNFYHIGFSPFFALALWKFKSLFALPSFNKILLASILLYIFFLAGVPYQNIRFHIPAAPLVFMFLFPALQAAFLDLQKRFSLLPLALGVYLVVALLLFGRAMKPTVERNSLEKEIVSEMKKWQGETLYAFDLDISLKGRGLRFDYQNLWEEEYSSFEKGALVLFNPEKFELQWKGKNPMLNWQNLNSNYVLDPIENLPQGWLLYRIQD